MKKRKRTSPIWVISKQEFENIVKKSNSFAKIIEHFGFSKSSSMYKVVKQRCLEDNIDYSHIPLGIDSNKGRRLPSRAYPLKEVMVENSTYQRSHLKRRLLKNGMLENKCKICEIGPEWNGLKLVMVLDHINGVNNDNRLENLRLLCPNCNSQQNTFCGRRKKKKYHCTKCGRQITKYSKSKLCMKCIGINNRKVKNRPNTEQLLKEIKELGYSGTGKKYGISGNALKKWLRKDGIDPPKIKFKKYYCTECEKKLVRKTKSGLCWNCYTLKYYHKNKNKNKEINKMETEEKDKITIVKKGLDPYNRDNHLKAERNLSDIINETVTILKTNEIIKLDDALEVGNKR